MVSSSFCKLIDIRWAEWTSSLWEHPWGDRYTKEEDEELKQNVRDVAGLWVFGADAFGEIPEIDPEEGWGYKLMRDLSDFRPGLMVFDINNRSI